MKTIFKYPLELKDEQEIDLPQHHEILCVQMQGPFPCIWALIDPEETHRQKVKITIRGTGHPLDTENLYYLGTVQQGPFVWHIFTD